MKHLLTLAALLVSNLSLAQFTPYNPDADNDQFVGAQDLLAFLPLFGEDWDLDSLNIYGLSELESPALCDSPYDNQCNDFDIWRVVPQDADVLFFDYQTDQYCPLVLPDIPKPLILFGVSSDPSIDVTEGYYNESNEYVAIDNAVLYGMQSQRNFTILMGFQGSWYVNK